MPAKKKAKDVLKESTPVGGGFASFFSLQSGTVMSSSILSVLAVASFFYNLSAPNPTEETDQYTSQYVVAYVVFVILFCGALTVTIAAFKFSSRWVLIGSCVLTVAAVIWLILSILSFITSIVVYKYVCIDNRCPPTVWLFEVSWRSSPLATDRDSDDGDPQARANDDGSEPSDEKDRPHGSTSPPNRTKFTGAVKNDSDIVTITGIVDVAVIEFPTEGFERNETAGNVDRSFSGDYHRADSLGRVERPARGALSSNGENRKANVNPNFLTPPKGGWNNPNVSSYWSWLLGSWNNLAKLRAKPFLSSYVPSTPEPGQTDSTIGMSIFCFIVLIVFWVYSLWTMFSHYKELKAEEEEEAAAAAEEEERQEQDASHFTAMSM